MSERDWVAWHAPYADPDSPLSRRLATVRELLADALTCCAPGPIRVVSICAGQGHDLLGVLEDHPRRGDVEARLVERDDRNVEVARARIVELDLPAVEVVADDAGHTSAYAGAVPADVILCCGVFGNISDDDIRTTIAALPSLCAPGAAVLWTRHRFEPDATPWIRTAFEGAGFEELTIDRPEDTGYVVGAGRLVTPPAPFTPRRLFTFVGFDALWS